jgi:centromeric protein E
VEQEWKSRVEKLEAQLESKKIWANRLDENVRAVTAENKALQSVSSVHEGRMAVSLKLVVSAVKRLSRRCF